MRKNSDQLRPIGAACINKLNPAGNRHIKYCGYTAVLLLILAAVALILASTVFRIRSLTIRVGNLTSGNLQLFSRGNITLNADVWVRNPNFASIEFGNMTTTFFYRDAVVGESRAPPGRAMARRTVMINAWMEIMTDRILSQPDLAADIVSGLVNVSSYTQVGGKIKLAIFEKQMTMKMCCNVSINVTNQKIREHQCTRKIKI